MWNRIQTNSPQLVICTKCWTSLRRGVKAIIPTHFFIKAQENLYFRTTLEQDHSMRKEFLFCPNRIRSSHFEEARIHPAITVRPTPVTCILTVRSNCTCQESVLLLTESSRPRTTPLSRSTLPTLTRRAEPSQVTTWPTPCPVTSELEVRVTTPSTDWPSRTVCWRTSGLTLVKKEDLLYM